MSVTATGELKPVTQVNIGTEISGIVESVEVDFNSPVTVGQTLARVNTEKLEAQAAQARAALRSAEAKQLQSEATMAEAEAELARLQHVRELSGGRVPSKQEMDSQEASVKRARADQREYRCTGRTITGQPDRHRNRYEESDHPLADQRHRARPSSRSGPDGGGLVSDADAVHARPGPDQDEADCRRRRSRHRQRPGRPDRTLPRRCVPGAIVRVEGQRSPQRAENDEWRRDLSNGPERWTTPSACSGPV